jgi:hypothetical protein
MVANSIKLDEKTIENLELVVKGLNAKSGGEIYNFSNVLREAINYYLCSDPIREIVETARRAGSEQRALLLVSKSSLGKDWLAPEEDEAWADL